MVANLIDWYSSWILNDTFQGHYYQLVYNVCWNIGHFLLIQMRHG